MNLTKLDLGVYLLQWTGEGRFNLETVKTVNDALDTVQNDPEARALITTGTGKIYSNGLELAKILSADPLEFLSEKFHPLLARLIRFPVLTIALIQGHAFAGGMIFALAHDYRIMRTDRGYLCMNEVTLPGTIPLGMMSILKAKMSNDRMLKECVLQGIRFNAEEAKSASIVDEIAAESELIGSAIRLARSKTKTFTSRPVISSIKESMYAEVLNALSAAVPPDTFAMSFESKI